MRIRRQLPIALAAPFLAACAQGMPAQTASTQRSVDAAEAFVMPPPGGPRIVSVVERRYNNATQQEISLATNAQTPGQNAFRVRLFGPVEPQWAGQTSASTLPLSFGNIQGEARAALPGMHVVRSPYYVQNRYGPFGYATAASGRDLCLYGWQRIDAAPKLIGNKGAVDIRLRFCQADATEQQLLALMYGYSVNAFFGSRNWNPYGDPPSPPPALGGTGAEIYPLDLARQPATVPEARPAAAAPARRVAAPAEPPSVVPAPRGTPVPPPPETGPAKTPVPLPPD